MAKNPKRIVWPINLDSHKTRKEGRILAKKEAIGAPDIDEIVQAAKELGLNPSREDDKMYPRFWWEYKGRVLIDVDGSKREAIRQTCRRGGRFHHMAQQWRIEFCTQPGGVCLGLQGEAELMLPLLLVVEIAVAATAHRAEQ